MPERFREINGGVSDFLYATHPQKIFIGEELPKELWVAKDLRNRLLISRLEEDKDIVKDEDPLNDLLCVFTKQCLAEGFVVRNGFYEARTQLVSAIELQGFRRACVNPLDKKHWDVIMEL